MSIAWPSAATSAGGLLRKLPAACGEETRRAHREKGNRKLFHGNMALTREMRRRMRSKREVHAGTPPSTRMLAMKVAKSLSDVKIASRRRDIYRRYHWACWPMRLCWRLFAERCKSKP